MDLFELLFRAYPTYVASGEICHELGLTPDQLRVQLARLADRDLIILSEAGGVCLSERGFRGVCGERASNF